jgi:hypothetical protein
MDSQPVPVPGTTKKHLMSDPALKLRQSTTNEVKILAGSLAAGLTANPLLVPSPAVTPAQLIAAAQAVSDQEAIAATADANAKTQNDLVAEKLTALEALITTSVTDSTNVVQHNGTQVGMLNIPLKGASVPAPHSGPPVNFSVTQGDHSTFVDGHCNKAQGSKMYKAEWATTPAGPWTECYSGSKSSFTATGLAVGAELWFRMAAYIGGVWTEWSNPAKCRVL